MDLQATGSSPALPHRDVAARLASLSGAVLVLGSATPSVVSFYRARRGRYRLIELPDRVRPSLAGTEAGPSRLPVVDVVDLARELREGNRSIFSRALSTGIARSLANHEQVLLFLNRRGAANFLLCRDCRTCPSLHTLRGVSDPAFGQPAIALPPMRAQPAGALRVPALPQPSHSKARPGHRACG